MCPQLDVSNFSRLAWRLGYVGGCNVDPRVGEGANQQFFVRHVDHVNRGSSRWSHPLQYDSFGTSDSRCLRIALAMRRLNHIARARSIERKHVLRLTEVIVAVSSGITSVTFCD